MTDELSDELHEQRMRFLIRRAQASAPGADRVAAWKAYYAAHMQRSTAQIRRMEAKFMPAQETPLER